MGDRRDQSREERYQRALRLAGEYRRLQAKGLAVPLEQYLHDHCDVRRQLEPLLTDGTLLPSAVAPATQPVQPPATIGPYRILARLGAGGMGTVWLAERRDPEQRVALKVIRRGFDSQALVRHFEHERSALAKMNHDAIAKVFDAGTTAAGEPWFAMELVEDGTPLTAYCDARELQIPARIRLFQQVCDGVQHAHRKGVVHRDLKPGNVLVTAQGERHGVKIIDFGIAGPAVPDADGSDGARRPVGTPEYMSPEQASGDARLIDSRTDVYSLGVMLYELLVGELPFASDELRDLPTVALQDRLRDSEPQRPSTRVTTSERATTSALARGLTVAALAKTVRGDLDWIVLRAMAKDPEQRYATPHDLALDLQRYLAHEPVSAVPPQLLYRTRKAIVRHRLAVGVGLALGALAITSAFAFVFHRESLAAEKSSQAIEDTMRRRQLLVDWNKHRRPDLIANDVTDFVRSRDAYQSALHVIGIRNYDRDLRELYRDDTTERTALLDELYWLELVLSRQPAADHSAAPSQLSQALVDGWLRDWEHRPWRLAGWQAMQRESSGERGLLGKFADSDLTAATLEDLEWLTLLLSVTGNTERLRGLLERINDRDNDRWWVRFRLATLTDGRDRLVHAAAAVALANERTATWFNYAWNFQFIKTPPFDDEVVAARCYRKAIELDPANWRAYLNLTYLVPEEEGVTLMRQAVQLVPHPDLYHRLAERLRNVRRCDESVEVSRRACELYPEHAGLHAIFGECLGWLSRWQEAIAPLERALTLAPSDATTRGNLQVALQRSAIAEKDRARRKQLQARLRELQSVPPALPK